ncbi:YciE/YciF ferroxidase family protein [Patulibacter defluvii]|uniref:YciE/YciF ferroxidase family protein n=1 Tax=Patulibacter defluvii TaxID=3095358 RepID=UPI002A754B70|nr:DUF892 family protein [Patulibacter sp. DM4]
MPQPADVLVQHLRDAHATEAGLVRVLQSQIAVAPRGDHRDALQAHLSETRSHAERVRRRLVELGAGDGPRSLRAGFALVQGVAAQAVAVGKLPLDLVRGKGGEEKVLKNARDGAAAEALEIATYRAIEALARAVGDPDTARLAREIRADEERMLDRLLADVSDLAEGVAAARVDGDPQWSAAETGAADAVRHARDEVADAVRGRFDDVADSARDARDRAVRTTERAADAAAGAVEPWPGYDEATVAEVERRLREDDDGPALSARVGAYERRHKARVGVLEAAERTTA